MKAQPAEGATTSGSGEYAEGTQVTVKATAKANYVFKYWMRDGEQQTQTSTSFKITMPAEDVEYVAVFEYVEPVDPGYDPVNPAEPQYITPEYALFLVADPVGSGTFNRTSGAKVKEGTAVSIKATPVTGYQFLGWYDADGILLTSSQTLSYTMPSQIATLTARFFYNPNDPNEPSGNQTDVDNNPDAVAEVKASPVLIQTQGSTVTIRGTAEGTPVAVYDLGGRQCGTAVSGKERATLRTKLPAGSTAIVKIGDKAVKVMVK